MPTALFFDTYCSELDDPAMYSRTSLNWDADAAEFPFMEGKVT
jgi:hypothetical protein